ncbi:unnamed protein product [Rhodiola kirilowii]
MELEGENPTPKASASSLRWRLLREALLRRLSQKNSCGESDMNVKRVSRRATNGFNMIPFHEVDHSTAADVVPSLSNENGSSDACYCYTLPVEGSKKLYLMQRVDEGASLKDFEVCNRYDIDNTGLVCQWPSEDLLAYFCLLHADMFRSKRVIELGSGYGLTGLVIGATSDAVEVIISDGNPQVVDYIQRNIHLNLEATGATKMNCMALHWNQEHASSLIGTFDIIVASDCTFFKEFHKGLAQTVKLLLKKKASSEALFFSPNRGDTLNKFLKEVKESGLHFSITENYDSEVWKRHEGFMNGDPQWPNYEKDHCYPLLVRITS